jgi:hypothetical protein
VSPILNSLSLSYRPTHDLLRSWCDTAVDHFPIGIRHSGLWLNVSLRATRDLAPQPPAVPANGAPSRPGETHEPAKVGQACGVVSGQRPSMNGHACTVCLLTTARREEARFEEGDWRRLTLGPPSPHKHPSSRSVHLR